MAICAQKFTPEVLLSAPRRSPAIPNKDGTLALFTVSSYSFKTHTKSFEIRIMNVKTGDSLILCSDLKASEPTWLGDRNLLLYLKSGEKGATSLYLADAERPDHEPQVLTTFNGPVANLKTATLDLNTIAIAFTGPANSAGELFSPDTAKKPISSGRIYDSLFVRQWDTYITENKNTIWYLTLTKSQGIYKTSTTLKNALAGHGFSLESPVPPFGGAGDFDIGKNGLVFVAKDPTLDQATYTKTDLYYVALRSFKEKLAPEPIRIETGNLKGYSNAPVFSPNGKSVVFTRMKSDSYESDKPRLLLIPDITDLSNVQEFFETDDGEGRWDLRPESITWSLDGKQLFVTAEEHGRVKLFKLSSSPHLALDLPVAIINDGTVTDVKVLPNGSLFISSSSFVESSLYSIICPEKPADRVSVSSILKAGEIFGLSQDQIDEFWFEGAESIKVHAWILKPSSFDKNKRYPLAYLIHGGPQGAWNESWSTRWNPAIFAEQGYIVVTPNPTGSTGYGMSFQNGIKNSWGGRPYVDLEKGFEFIEANMPFVDTSRAVALGASYGGYMINWIQGHNFGRKFKALVTHDGVFSTLNQVASDELFFPHHDFDGTLWENRKNYEAWDPARFLHNWATPHLIIHNELDYRLPISEGLATFNVLQSKGVESRFLSFPDENHWVLKHENSLVWHNEVLRWINKYSGVSDDQEASRKKLAEITVR
ncbi:Dipeptidyl-peptidase 5 [Podosphaera aphanis]|nr:Dipeptidyl-peptidase 5 [Podosphaera aphanis]